MAKNEISKTTKDDNALNKNLPSLEKLKPNPRLKLGSQEDATKFNKGGVLIIPLGRKSTLT